MDYELVYWLKLGWIVRHMNRELIDENIGLVIGVRVDCGVDCGVGINNGLQCC